MSCTAGWPMPLRQAYGGSFSISYLDNNLGDWIGLRLVFRKFD